MRVYLKNNHTKFILIGFETMDPQAFLRSFTQQEQQDEQRYEISYWSKNEVDGAVVVVELVSSQGGSREMG